jgi:hypothetical protein
MLLNVTRPLASSVSASLNSQPCFFITKEDVAAPARPNNATSGFREDESGRRVAWNGKSRVVAPRLAQHPGVLDDVDESSRF